MGDYKTVLKRESLNLFYGLLLITALMTFQAVFKPSLKTFIVVMLCFNTAWLFCFSDLTLKRWTINSAVLIGSAYLYHWLGTKGLIGATVGVIIAVTLVLGLKWRKILEAKYTIERLIWGERLKDIIARGERPPKLKIKF